MKHWWFGITIYYLFLLFYNLIQWLQVLAIILRISDPYPLPLVKNNDYSHFIWKPSTFVKGGGQLPLRGECQSVLCCTCYIFIYQHLEAFPSHPSILYNTLEIHKHLFVLYKSLPLTQIIESSSYYLS